MTTAPPRRREGPDGPLSGIVWQQHCQGYAVINHSIVEGRPEVDCGVVLDSYDRVEHPWMHGRRAHDLVERIREVLPL